MKLHVNILIFSCSILISINQLLANEFNKSVNVIGVNGKNVFVKSLFDNEDWKKLNESMSSLPSPVDSIFRLITSTIIHFYNAGSEIINNNQLPPTHAMDKTVVVRDLFISETPKILNKYYSNDRKSLPSDVRNILDKFDESYEEFILTCLLKINDKAADKVCRPDSQKRLKQLMYNSTNSLENNFYKIIIDKFNQTIPWNEMTNPYPEDGFYHSIIEQWKDNGEDCGTENSLQLKIHNLSWSIINSIGKYYATLTLGYMLDFLNNLSNNQYFRFSQTTVEGKCLVKSLKIVEKFNKEVIIIMKNTQWMMTHILSDIKRCDVGQQHEEDITFQRFRIFDAAFLYNVLNRHSIEKFMTYGDNVVSVDEKKCTQLKKVNSASFYYTTKNYTQERQSHHVVIKYFDGTMETFGKKNTTEMEMESSYELPSFICYIEHTGDNFEKVVRDISLVPVEADLNYVVTGIRWRIKSRVLFMEIQQGKFSNGTVVADTVGWKSTPENWIPADRIPLRTNLGIRGTNGFVLDDIVLPPEFYVTGVQFDWNKNFGMDKTWQDIEINHLMKIKIQGTKFGIDSTEVVWKTMVTPSVDSSEEVAIDEADASEYSPENKIIEMPVDKYVKFHSTDMKKDLARNTVPYLDIQDVYLESPEPLRGIGMYYKGNPSYGGFIGLRAFSNDISGLMDSSEVEKHFNGINGVFSEFQKAKTTR